MSHDIFNLNYKYMLYVLFIKAHIRI